MKSKLFVIIPAYNEGKRIGPVLEKVKKYSKNIIVVDDCSKDDTSEQARKKKVIVLSNNPNAGKGVALKKGCDYALKKGAKTIIVMDADGQHEPKDIPRFLKALDGNDIVFGSRKIDKNMPSVFKFGNWFINKTTTLLSGIKLVDTQSGFRAFTANTYRKIRWKSTRYSVESEMILRVGAKKLRYNEIFIKTIYHDSSKGTTVWDGIKIVANMIKWKIKGGV
ncbi:glycosyltransferase family 2 protein [Thermoproteota archaeon]